MPIYLREGVLYNSAERMKFKYWYARNYSPNLRIVAEKIGINYNTLRNWNNGYHDLNEEKLQLVHDFLERELNSSGKEKTTV